jgi:hypothetical protein
MRLQKQQVPASALIDGIAANAGVPALTFVLPVPYAARASFTAVLTWAAATDLTLELYESVDGGLTYGRIQSIAVAAGTGTMSDYKPTKATGGAGLSIAANVNTESCTHIKGIVAAASGGANDLITVKGCMGIYK